MLLLHIYTRIYLPRPLPRTIEHNNYTTELQRAQSLRHVKPLSRGPVVKLVRCSYSVCYYVESGYRFCVYSPWLVQ